MLEGRYTPAYLEKAGANAPKLTDDEYLDFKTQQRSPATTRSLPG
jgi:hypothetical protein